MVLSWPGTIHELSWETNSCLLWFSEETLITYSKCRLSSACIKDIYLYWYIYFLKIIFVAACIGSVLLFLITYI